MIAITKSWASDIHMTKSFWTSHKPIKFSLAKRRFSVEQCLIIKAHETNCSSLSILFVNLKKKSFWSQVTIFILWVPAELLMDHVPQDDNLNSHRTNIYAMSTGCWEKKHGSLKMSLSLWHIYLSPWLPVLHISLGLYLKFFTVMKTEWTGREYFWQISWRKSHKW